MTPVPVGNEELIQTLFAAFAAEPDTGRSLPPDVRRSGDCLAAEVYPAARSSPAIAGPVATTDACAVERPLLLRATSAADNAFRFGFDALLDRNRLGFESDDERELSLQQCGLERY